MSASTARLEQKLLLSAFAPQGHNCRRANITFRLLRFLTSLGNPLSVIKHNTFVLETMYIYQFCVLPYKTQTQEGKYHLLGFFTSLDEPLSIMKQNASPLENGVA